MNTQATTGNPLGTAPVGSLLKKFAIPSIISMVVNALYNIVDQIFIGQGVGMDALAAEFREMGALLLTLTLALGNVTFFLIDRILSRIISRKNRGGG